MSVEPEPIRSTSGEFDVPLQEPEEEKGVEVLSRHGRTEPIRKGTEIIGGKKASEVERVNRSGQ